VAEPRSPGTVLDGFRLEEKIHQGGMAEIWRVTRPDLPAPAVMKIPSFRDSADPAALVGFEVEQMILPTLSGPHVPRFIAAGDWETQTYIVMELISGPSLRRRLDDAPLDPAEVASIGSRVASALHDLHAQHVIHLDVKPSNVMFRPSREAVLIDFGLSRHDQLPDLLAEQFRLPMGTGPYISPEQIWGVRNDPRSDLFALGVLLYHLLTGQRPFGNPSSLRGLRRRLYRDPVPPRALNAACPPWLQEVVLRCLEVDASKRWDTAAHLAFELQHPEQVSLGDRSQRVQRDGLWTVARRRFRSVGEPNARQSAAGQVARAPIVLVALDLSGTEALADALRLAARRVAQTEPGARLACVTVLKTPRMAIEANAEAEGSVRMDLLVRLKHWARPLEKEAARVTHHVLEAPDPAAAILEFAAANRVDQIVLGSRGSSTLRRYLGSVSSEIVAQALCTVTVVKTPPRDGDSPKPSLSDAPTPSDEPLTSDEGGN
jgi:nucleotide-binding universal stress UspA family protein